MRSFDKPAIKELADKVRDEIHERELRSGDFFMTEKEMAEQYGVSLKIAREAAMHLRGLGILTSRKRKGLIVAEVDPVNLLAAGLPSIANSDEGLIELARLRYVIEIGAIELSVKNASETQIEQLAECARKLEKIIRSDRGDEAENKVELEFHGLILEMTGSELIRRLQKVLAKFFELSTESEKKSVNQDETIWQHSELIRAFRNRDIELARVMIRAQFRNIL